MIGIKIFKKTFDLNRFGFIFFILLFSCETEIDVNAPYKDVTVVYGVLDSSKDTNYIKVNKTFLEDGDVNEVAKEKGILDYGETELEVKIKEFNSNGIELKTHILTRTVNAIEKDPGVFDNTTNVLYRLIASIDSSNTYKLEIYNKDLGKTISAETKIPKGPFHAELLNGKQYKFINTFGDHVDKVVAQKGGSFIPSNTGRIQAVFVFKYREIEDGVVSEKRIELDLGQVIAGGEDIQFTISGSVFFNLLDRELLPLPTNVKRELTSDHVPDVEFYLAGKDLATYISVSDPSNTTSTFQYTNVTNGVGVFSSRSKNILSLFAPGGNTGYDGFTLAELERKYFFNK